MEERKGRPSIYLVFCATSSVSERARNLAPDLRRSVNGWRLMITSKISVVAAAVSPPLLIPHTAISHRAVRVCSVGPSSSSTLSCTLQFIQGVANPPGVIMLIYYPRQTPPDNDRLPIASAYPVIFFLAFCPALTPSGGKRVTWAQTARQPWAGRRSLNNGPHVRAMFWLLHSFA